MPQILDTLAQSQGRFTPKNLNQFLALQIAQGLSDTGNLKNYLLLIEHYPPHILVVCYKKTKANGGSGEHFLASLRELTHTQQ
jgi:hypothetical protein